MAQTRFAGLADIDNIVQLAIKAMEDDPMQGYLYPNRYKFPVDHYNNTKATYEQFLDPNNDDWCVLLVELKLRKEHSQTVAFSVWNISSTKNKQYQPPNSTDTQNDTDQARMKAFQDGIVASEAYFAKYNGCTIRLHILGTHPNYRRQGYAKSLCLWGMGVAKDFGLVVQVVASKMGQDLYAHLKFATLGKVLRQVPGEETKLISYAMVFNPENQAPSNVAASNGQRQIV